MNYGALSETFQRDGYLQLDDFFDAELMQRIDTRIIEHFGENPAFLHSDEFLEKAKTDVCVYRNMRYRFSTETVVEERTA